MIKKIFIIICHVIILSASNILPYISEVEDISGQRYYPAVKKVIENAEDSIYMSMFVVSLYPDRKDSAVYDLCESLVEANDRGINVKVILDQNISFYDDEYRDKVEGKNVNAYQYFKNNEIDVYYDNRSIYTHSKTLIVDEEIVILGSTNWSYSALTRNNESSVLIKSLDLAKSFIENFKEIELASPKLKRPFDKEKALKLQKDFLENKELAGRMITKQDERAFDLYLLLLYNAKEINTIDFDFDEYAKDLGIEDMTVNAYRRQIIKSLRKLKSRYDLIKVEFEHGKNADVKLLDINDEDNDYNYPEENYFLLPAEYFKYGWNRKLKFAGKFSYLINRYMVQENKSKYWSMGRIQLTEKFNLEKDAITKGMQELRKLNIIDIDYSPTNEDGKHIAPSIYKLIGLYSSEEHEKKLGQLEEKYGKERLKKAREFTEVVYRQNDIEAIERIINLTEEYGEEKIKKAQEILSKKAIDNPKRTFRYAAGIIKRSKE
ncbi:MAG: phospholipase D-like domain-containing protein [Atribacterota bacterium]